MSVSDEALPSPEQVLSRLEGVMLADRARLSRRVRDLMGRRGDVPESDVRSLLEQVARSEERVLARKSAVPTIRFPDDLPVSQRREEIREAIQKHQVVVVCGETGSGKTTQLPKICLELGRGVLGLIGHTQPRRIAARSVAARVSEELGGSLGELVGFKVRFGDQTSPRNLVKVMTDGILLAETQTDRLLQQYDTIIIDEAHERSLNIDFLLGYLKTLLPKRPDLKVIVTSATIDPERFARHFATRSAQGVDVAAPIIMVSGRTYPVEVLYREPPEEDLDERDKEFQRHLLDAVDELAARGRGDVLVFLSGEREIRETAETLHKHSIPGEGAPHVLPLYARLSAEEQARVFQPHEGRRIVLATNVAETSLTVPGIRAVIDPGLARINRYSPRTKVQRLEIEPVSRASADQRKGRCGRLGPGVCVRLYSEADYAARPAFTDPEIVRTNLASVILQMAFLGLGKVEDFPFVEAPDSRMVRDGYETLHELGAIDDENRLTPLGRDLARLPIDPRIGRMILAAGKEGSLSEVLVIASALSIQDPRERPTAKQHEADARHEQWSDAQSDFASFLNLWKDWRHNRTHLTGSRLRRWCKDNFLSYVRMREWDDVHQQLAELASELKLRGNREAAPTERVHRALLTGLLGNIGLKGEQGEYQGGRGNRFRIFPGSALFRQGATWVMAAEIVRTTQVYARMNAAVQPEWIEELGAHLLKRTYSEPRWDRQSGRVIANERVTIFGIELVPKRRVHFGAVNPKEAREIFIHHALVLGDMNTRAEFMAHNKELEAQVSELETRARRHSLLSDMEKRYRYFDTRVPAEIVTAGAFEKWRFAETKDNPRLLFMSLEDLLSGEAALPTLEQFPDEVDVGHLRLPVRYRFETGHEEDGVTVRIPVDALGQVTPEPLSWLVPGHLREKVEAILRGLPKEFRRILPVPSQLTDQVMPALLEARGRGALVDALRAAVLKASTIDVPREVLSAVTLPAWMAMRAEAVDEAGKVLAAGRDVNQLKALLAPRVKQGLLTSPHRFTRENIKTWDFGDLPERVEMDSAGVRFAAYPGIVDTKTAVALRLFDSFESAQLATRAGSRRLFIFAASDAVRRHCAYLPGLEQMALWHATLGPASVLREQLTELIADRAFIGDLLPVRTEKEFAFRVTRGAERLGPAVQEVLPVAQQTLQQFHECQKELSRTHPAAFAESVGEMQQTLRDLCGPGFLSATPWEWLRHYPRYLQAIRVRLSRLPGGGVAKDRKLAEQVTPLQRGLEELQRRQKELGLDAALVEQFRWHLHELRVSLFAQELRTAVPVSVKRMHDLWGAIVRGESARSAS